MRNISKELSIKIIVIGIVINFAIASMISLLKLPIYMDAIGTIMVTIMLGRNAGMVAGIFGFGLMTITGIGPYHIYFIGTQVAIAISTSILASRAMFSSLTKTIISGIIIGVIAAIVSAPIIVYLFGGVEGNGAGLITAFLIQTGKTVMESVVLKGISIEPIDKSLQCLIVYFTLSWISKKQLLSLNSPLININFLENDKS